MSVQYFNYSLKSAQTTVLKGSLVASSLLFKVCGAMSYNVAAWTTWRAVGPQVLQLAFSLVKAHEERQTSMIAVQTMVGIPP